MLDMILALAIAAPAPFDKPKLIDPYPEFRIGKSWEGSEGYLILNRDREAVFYEKHSHAKYYGVWSITTGPRLHIYMNGGPYIFFVYQTNHLIAQSAPLNAKVILPHYLTYGSKK